MTFEDKLVDAINNSRSEDIVAMSPDLAHIALAAILFVRESDNIEAMKLYDQLIEKIEGAQ